MNELKPCPFCGGEAESDWDFDEDGDRVYGVSCLKCGAQTNGFYSYPSEATGEEKAVEAWNHRVEEAQA